MSLLALLRTQCSLRQPPELAWMIALRIRFHYHGRCVEVLMISSTDGRAHPQLPPLVLGVVMMTQASSIRTLVLSLGAAAITGAEAAVLVRSGTARVILPWQNIGAAAAV